MSAGSGHRPAALRGRNRTSVRAAALDAMITEATMDCYNESEAVTGFLTMIEDNLALPFESQVLGESVRVEKVDVTESGEIVGICARNGFRQSIALLDLPLPRPAPEAAPWIDAYRRWRA